MTGGATFPVALLALASKRLSSREAGLAAAIAVPVVTLAIEGVVYGTAFATFILAFLTLYPLAVYLVTSALKRRFFPTPGVTAPWIERMNAEEDAALDR